MASLKLMALPARQSSCASVYTTAAEMLARWLVVREEGAGRRARGAVLGRVLGRVEARLHAEPVYLSHEITVHRSGVLGDEEEHVVALALRVGVAVLGAGGDPPEAGAAVE